MRYTPNVQLGIVQSDVLSFLRARADGLVDAGLSPEDQDKLSDMLDRLKLVLPLYIEEVHVLARKEIASIEDLAGKKVSVGKNGGGTFITADQIFRNLGIAIQPISNVSTETALTLLRRGNIDAMVYVVGQPASVFQDSVTAEDGFHLLPLRGSEKLDHYDVAEISSDSYAWLNENVETIGVRSLLISYNYQQDEMCGAISGLAQAVRDSLGDLREGGHKKWRDVLLDAKVSVWKPYEGCPEGGEAPAAATAAEEPQPSGGLDLLQKFKR